MPTYTYTCPKDGDFEVVLKMQEVTACQECPTCSTHSPRNFQIDLNNVPTIWHTDGAHNTDYGKTGHKQDQLAKAYEKETGEKAPEPAKDVPKNYKVERDPARHVKRTES